MVPLFRHFGHLNYTIFRAELIATHFPFLARLCMGYCNIFHRFFAFTFAFDFCCISLLLALRHISRNISLGIDETAFLVLYYSLRDRPSFTWIWFDNLILADFGLSLNTFSDFCPISIVALHNIFKHYAQPLDLTLKIWYNLYGNL